MKILVTGGGGFLGKHIAQRLDQLGHEVTILGRHKYSGVPENINSIQADLRNRQEIINACQNVEVVFHSGALTGIWGARNDFYETNVNGTENILEACLKNNVKKLIYTSSPSVVFEQKDLINADESIPYAKKFLCEYPKTKAIAEQMVINANGKNDLATVSLRPHLIWGPEDPHLIPRIINRAKNNQLIQVGEGQNLVDIIYIDNAVEGHIQAFKSLSTNPQIAGESYFISDGKPVNLWKWINQLLEKLSLPPVQKKISFKLGNNLGWLLEKVYGLFGIQSEPRMTRFLACQLAHSHYFNISKARKDLSYKPLITNEEGMKKVVEYFKAPPIN